jgi:hypothetical protein
MAIQPIDLQTLFTQIDKVGRSQSAMREGLDVQQAMQGVQIERKTGEQIQSVNQAQNMGEGVEKVKDKNSGGQEKDGAKNKEGGNAKNETPQEKPERPVIKDLRLGANIDISL